MTPETATGLILRTRPLTETSLIVHWLTRDLGRISTVAKGARRPKSSFRGQLDLFYIADFSFARSARSDLHTLREVKLLETHLPLRMDLAYLEQAAYCAKLVELATEPETPLPGLFERFCAMLASIPKAPAQATTVFSFEMKLLEDLGLSPDLTEAALSPGSRQVLAKILEINWPDLHMLKLDSRQEAEIRTFLHGFITYHLERIPKGRSRAVKSSLH